MRRRKRALLVLLCIVLWLVACWTLVYVAYGIFGSSPAGREMKSLRAAAEPELEKSLVSPGGRWRADLYYINDVGAFGQVLERLEVVDMRGHNASRTIYEGRSLEQYRWIDRNTFVVNGQAIDVRTDSYEAIRLRAYRKYWLGVAYDVSRRSGVVLLPVLVAVCLALTYLPQRVPRGAVRTAIAAVVVLVGDVTTRLATQSIATRALHDAGSGALSVSRAMWAAPYVSVHIALLYWIPAVVMGLCAVKSDRPPLRTVAVLGVMAFLCAWPPLLLLAVGAAALEL